MNIAIVIDADNASHDSLDDIIRETEKHGRVAIKRAYGDFMKNCCLNPWIDKLKTHGFEIRQNFNHSTGKNSTDIALVIDAMDILHNNSVQGFCIVSSDSDFTHLAVRIKSQGLFCLGIGRFNTLPAFKSACDKFAHLENLKIEEVTVGNSDLIKTEAPKLPGLNVVGKIQLDEVNLHSHIPKHNIKESGINTCIISEEDKKVLLRAFELSSGQTGIALLSKMSETLKRIKPEFSHKKYGFKKFSQFMSAIKELFVVKINTDGMTYSIQLAA